MRLNVGQIVHEGSFLKSLCAPFCRGERYTVSEVRVRRDQAITLLRNNEAHLRAAGLLHVRLFGSVARDEATDHSDVDVLAEFAPGLGLFEISSLRLNLCEMLGAEVDLTSETWLKEAVRKRAMHEAVHAF